ncbi:RHS repeat domain-containing protein, partial [Yersinia pestis]
LAQASQQQQAGRVVKRGDSQYRYDAAGRLVEKRSQKDGYRPQLWRYRWNEQDQLSELITPTGARWRYGYDAFGRRIRKLRVVDTPPLNEMDAPSTGPATASLAGYAYLWSGDQLIEEVPVYADGTVAYEQGIHWLYAPGGLTPMARYAQGKLHYVVADHLGTPRELLNEQGKVVWASRLSTWGQAELWRQAANEEDRVSCNLRFAGQYADAESGLHYNRFRYYDGETGQYLCPDPIGLEGGLNPYGYVHNPVSWVDPLGLATCPMREVNGTKIFGKGQKDGTPGHDQFSEVIANKLAMSGKFKEVYLNRSYNFANGKGISGRRPDIMAVDMNGKVHAIELASKTDMGRKFPSLRTRNQDAMKNLPSIDRGSVIVLEHQYNSSKIKNALDNLISGI